MEVLFLLPGRGVAVVEVIKFLSSNKSLAMLIIIIFDIWSSSIVLNVNWSALRAVHVRVPAQVRAQKGAWW